MAAGAGVGDEHFAFHGVGVAEEQAELAPKSVTVPSVAPASVRRCRICVNSSRSAARRPMWSSRPRPNMGVWWSAWRLSLISNTFSSLLGPMLMIVMRGPGVLLSVEFDGGSEHVDVEALQSVGVVGDDGDMVKSHGQHGVVPSWWQICRKHGRRASSTGAATSIVPGGVCGPGRAVVGVRTVRRGRRPHGSSGLVSRLRLRCIGLRSGRGVALWVGGSRRVGAGQRHRPRSGVR